MVNCLCCAERTSGAEGIEGLATLVKTCTAEQYNDQGAKEIRPTGTPLNPCT